MSLAQGTQAVQAPALIVILQKLHKAWVADRCARQNRSGPQAFSPCPFPSKETHSDTWRKTETGSGTSGT